MGVNLHVNEMALSALVSDCKCVRAIDAIFGVGVYSSWFHVQTLYASMFGRLLFFYFVTV